jgi:hypothetical protein
VGGENSGAVSAAGDVGEVAPAQPAKLLAARGKDVRAEILQTELGRYPVDPGANITFLPDLWI